MRRIFVILGLFLVWLNTAPAASVLAQAPNTPAGPISISAKTAGMEKLPGYVALYWDAKAGKMWLEAGDWGTEFLYIESLPAGIGSNDIGLDRGQLGATRVVRWERSGPKVLLVEPNYGYRATSDSAEERRAVRDSFAESVLWGFEAAAEEDGRVLVDATNFFLRDTHNVTAALQRTKQGNFRLDFTRSAFYLPRTRNFPLNTEVEVTLTFTGDDPGNWLQQVVPTPQAVTVREHQSFVKLPEPGYRMRRYDPRAGYFAIQYADYATPVGEPLVKRYIARHRLAKKDPAARVSEPVAPIIYYLDRGAPEPIRSALLDGMRWWNQAFEAAGYKDAFRVELMPEGADPMDVRYNVVQWVHRATRGWSYGGAVVDPRTGEMLKGHVTLGSLRVRQDYMIAEGLLAPYTDDGDPEASGPPGMLAMSLARLRQLAAHEVGHSLGLQHNFAASISDRASVMDYPHPLVTLGKDGAPDLSNAYATGIGEWDKVAIAYGYQDFPAGTDEGKALDGILAGARGRGLRFLTDQDARPPGGASPIAHLWDNGTNAVDELTRVMGVRAAALKRFSERNVRPGAPLATLEDVLVPIFLLHRYQVEAAIKEIGGVDYTFALRGDGQKPLAPVPAEEQRRALDAVLRTLDPGVLALPEAALGLIPPKPPGYARDREDFHGHTGLIFDGLAPAEAAANHVAGLLLNPERAARLVQIHSQDAKMPGLEEIVDRLLAATWKAPRSASNSGGYSSEVGRTVDDVALEHLFALAINEQAPAQVRAVTWSKLEELRKWLGAQSGVTDAAQRAHFGYAAARIAVFQKNPKEWKPAPATQVPEGQPIGMGVLALSPWICDADEGP
ncbi:MAG TPA: zinc-dependent metalloprotease [Candidatus Solibacter sp.]|nr:zinc-dependent metalloprotease [Candidatus Solibacter sp.]